MSIKQIGVLGCARIVERALLQPVRQLEHLNVYAVAGSSEQRASAYADQHGIARSFGNYKELLACKEIDFVYIALSNELHQEWAIKALQYGKPVLVEKPICLNTEELDELMSVQSAVKLPVLEGLMVQHHPWQQELRRIVEERPYGCVTGVKSYIAVPFQDPQQLNYRSLPGCGGGVFYDLGCYWLQFIQAIFGLNLGWLNAQSAFDGPNGCDWSFRAELNLAEGVRAELLTSFELSAGSRHTIEFEHATVTVEPFFRPSFGSYKIAIRVQRKGNGETEKIVFGAQNYFTNQLAFFSDVMDGLQVNIPLQDSFARIELLEKLLHNARTKTQHHPVKKEAFLMIQIIMDILCEVKNAPELRASLKPQTDIIQQVGLDSLQMINFVLAIEDAFDLEIDFETFDYEHMSSIERLAGFLEREKAAAS
ncbi:Gfo/Idh/MocA family oxidoreductase [Paenibacillus sp. GCM10012307]|nr:Gfo/Idh/MocA family oxidoreductase [Paenibacillus roseus]